MYHHLAHLDSFEVGLKDKMVIKRGDKLGKVGNTGTVSPHLHYEIRKTRPSHWTQYIWGMTKAEVENLYNNPIGYIDKKNNIPAPFNNESGYGWLDMIYDGKGGIRGFHPGIDINDGGSYSDLGNIIKSPCDGTIVFLGTDTSVVGWGNHIWIKEKEINPMKDYNDHLIQETEEYGTFALVYGGEKHIISTNRAGLAALTVAARKMPYSAVTKKIWEEIPTGNDF